MIRLSKEQVIKLHTQLNTPAFTRKQQGFVLDW